VSPTIFQFENFRFFFFSREEPRMHVHVYTPNGEAKFWLEPEIELAVSKGLKSSELKVAETLIRRKQNEIREAWEKHFG